MPATLTYPGVYIEEIASGVRTVTGVSTSVTAFIGRSAKGSVNQAVVINSFADFERQFGGLWLDSHLGYAVRDFYLNGGSQAVIVRLYNAHAVDPAKASVDLAAAAETLTLETANEGAWGNHLQVSIDHTIEAGVAEQYGLTVDELFNLSIEDTLSAETEQFLNLSLKDSARRINKVLENESKLLRVSTDLDSLTEDRPDIVADVAMTVLGADGERLDAASLLGSQSQKTGLYALEKTDIFNLLCIPPYTADANVDSNVLAAAVAYCEDRRAFMLIDAPSSWHDKEDAKTGITSLGVNSKNAAVFFPRVIQADPLRSNQLEEFVPCGAIAGTMARIDTDRGLWKAPAGLDATLSGISQLSVLLTDDENGELNPLGINCLRTMPASGPVIWGSRTLQGNDRLASEWKYIPVRRLALHIEESLYRGTRWVVFEPNDEPLWIQIRLNITGFMHTLFRQGAFQGQTPKQAYFVKCDKETTTAEDIERGVVNIVVGFAALKPAEFVVIKLQQIANQTAL
ncbi:MAG: phage tail sheath subtilisin-like domain-containing protein [Pseudomonadales bacterium]